MSNLLKGTLFANSLLAGLLTGIVAAVLSLTYTIIYRDAAHYSGGIIVMPVSIFIGFPILLAILGCAHFLVRKYLHFHRKGFALFCIAAMILFSLIIILDTRENTGLLFSGFRGLCLGLVIISSLLGAFLIPYLARHPDMYE